MLHPAIHRLGGPASQSVPQDEATLYIRGFMSSVHRPTEQVAWRRNHEEVIHIHGCGGEAFDYGWQHNRNAGLPDIIPEQMARCISSLGYTPVPVFSPTMMAMRLASALRRQRRQGICARPSRVALALAADVLFHGGRVYLQWTYATANARAEAEVQRLRSALVAMRTKYPRVRVVAYSLGCRLALHTCSLLPKGSRPDEVHLLAAAVRASEARPLLSGLSRGSTHVYFSQDDLVLKILYGVAEGNPALGYEGLPLLSQVLETGRASDVVPHNGERTDLTHAIVQYDTSLLAEGKVSRSNPLAMHLMYSQLWGKIAYGGERQREDESR